MSLDFDLDEEESGGGGGEGGMMRWLLTYADMITLLMAFFIMMYSMSVISDEKFGAAASSLRSEFGPGRPSGGIAAGGDSLLPHLSRGDADNLPALAGNVESVRRELDEYIQENQLEDVVHTSRESRGLVITLVSDNLLFSVGQAELRPPALAILDQIAELLCNLPNAIAIEGHTCSLPISTSRYPSNWELSAARACAVVRHLIERWQIDPVRLAATGCADSRPVGSNESEETRALNRRVEFVILSDTGLPSAGDPVAEASREPAATSPVEPALGTVP